MFKYNLPNLVGTGTTLKKCETTMEFDVFKKANNLFEKEEKRIMSNCFKRHEKKMKHQINKCCVPVAVLCELSDFSQIKPEKKVRHSLLRKEKSVTKCVKTSAKMGGRNN